MSDSYWNWEDDSDIICPYCGEVYEPSYEETYIGDKIADCYTEDTEIYTCDCCHRRFEMRGVPSRVELLYRDDRRRIIRERTRKQGVA